MTITNLYPNNNDTTSLPDCDLCRDAGTYTPAWADANLPEFGGGWAYLCEKHFNEFGCSLGLGAGQRLIPTLSEQSM